MRILKIKKFVAKHRKLAIFAMAIILVALLYISWRFFAPYFTEVKLSTEYIGFIGTLLGAIVGGTFSLLGSIGIQKRQTRIQNDLHRSETIYKPLYEEFIRMHKKTLKRFPYYVFVKRPGDTQHAVYYEVWDQIKKDSRYLEVPDKLKTQVEKLMASIEAYNKSYQELNSDLERVIGEVSKKYPIIPERQIGWASRIIRCVLDRGEIDAGMALPITCTYRQDYDQEHIDAFDQYARELNEACRQLKQVDIVYQKRAQWNNTEEETIKLLEYLIQYSIIRYEG